MQRVLMFILGCLIRGAALCAPVALLSSPTLAQSDSAGPVRVTAEIESNQVFVGQPVTLQVSVEGDTRSQPPTIPEIDGVRVEERGSSTNSEIVFDGTRTVERTRRVFQYALTPTREGSITVPPIEVRTRDGVKRTEPLRIKVEAPGELDDFKLRLETDAREVYAGQPVTLRLTWFLGREVRTAAFSMPALPDGFHLYSPADDGLTPAHFQSGQFFEVMFLGERSVARAGRGEINGREFYTLTIEKQIVPTSAGAYSLGPATVAFTEPSHARRSIFDSPVFDQGRAQTQVVASDALTLNVKPLPTQGRPATFSGLVGDYRLEAQAEPRQVRVGDPITLTVTVRGDGPSDEIPMLDLSGQPGFEKSFKLTGERPTSEATTGGRRFTTMIRAREADVSAVPPIELTYFDPKAGEYRTTASDPISLRVQATQRVELPGSDPSANADAQSSDSGAVGSATAQTNGPRRVRTEDLSSRNEGLLMRLRGPLGLAVVAAPPVGALALIVAAVARRRSNADPFKKRRAHALRRALRALDATPGAEGALDAVRTFAADWQGRSRDAITSDEAAGFLAQASAEDSQAVREAVGVCAASEYGGAGASDLSVARETLRTALTRIDGVLRAKGEPR